MWYSFTAKKQISKSVALQGYTMKHLLVALSKKAGLPKKLAIFASAS